MREGQRTMTTAAPRVTRTYRALKGVAWIVISVFYRRIDVTGDGAWRAPGRPTIVVANHTNALADPVVILAELPGHPRFLAAGSWWKFAPARWLFRLAGVVPVYRQRDGGGAGANVATFAACHEALAEGATLAVFPEGELHNEPSIAPLKTGAARIALGAAADAGVADVVVLPVGIVYEDRGRFRSQAAVQVGSPIPVDPWVDRYREDPRGAARALTEAVARGLRAVTVNHESWDDLRLVDRAAAVALADDDTTERRYAAPQRAASRPGRGTGAHRWTRRSGLGRPGGTRRHPPARARRPRPRSRTRVADDRTPPSRADARAVGPDRSRSGRRDRRSGQRAGGGRAQGGEGGGEGPGVAGDVEGCRRAPPVPDRVGDRGLPRASARTAGPVRRRGGGAPRRPGLDRVARGARPLASGAGRGSAPREARRRGAGGGVDPGRRAARPSTSSSRTR